MNNQMIFVRIATISDIKYVNEIIKETEASALARGTGIAKRTAESVAQKMRDGKAIIALTSTGQWVGFAYFECWEHEKYISNSGLIVAPGYRNAGVAKSIKSRVFKVARRMYPHAKVFSITSGTAVMKLNAALGLQPVAFSEITQDEKFWEGCKSCCNYDILQRTEKRHCLCTAMLLDPELSLGCNILSTDETHQRYANKSSK